jgi:hypothetical protein
MVAVLLLFVAPAEKVKVAWPLVPVEIEDALTWPDVADTVSVLAAKTALPELSEVAVMVTEFVPSLLTLLAEVVSEIAAVVAAPPVVLVEVEVPAVPLAPQPPNNVAKAAINITDKVLAKFK